MVSCFPRSSASSAELNGAVPVNIYQLVSASGLSYKQHTEGAEIKSKLNVTTTPTLRTGNAYCMQIRVSFFLLFCLQRKLLETLLVPKHLVEEKRSLFTGDCPVLLSFLNFKLIPPTVQPLVRSSYFFFMEKRLRSPCK